MLKKKPIHFRVKKSSIPRRWRSLDKGESLACQITYPFNNNLGCFKIKFNRFLLNDEVILQTSDSPLSTQRASCLNDQNKNNFTCEN